MNEPIANPYPVCPVPPKYSAHPDGEPSNDTPLFASKRDPRRPMPVDYACLACFNRLKREPGPPIAWPPGNGIDTLEDALISEKAKKELAASPDRAEPITEELAALEESAEESVSVDPSESIGLDDLGEIL